MNKTAHQQVELLLKVLPHVMAEPCFALKGGTAINLFLRDMPRLSVDIDLTYLPIEERKTSLQNVSQALQRIAQKASKLPWDIQIYPQKGQRSDRTKGLLIRSKQVQIKVEPNEVLRGSVYPSETKDLCQQAQHTFNLFVSVKTLSPADLYGGKICAALDRQHPRDLFDIKLLFETEGITPPIRKAFVVYLASHNRPMHELLEPHRIDFRAVFENEFSGMTLTAITYNELIKAREQLIQSIQTTLTPKEKEFILSVKETTPQWDLLEIEGIEKLPAIQWKIQNIQKMEKSKRQKALQKLKVILDL